MPIITNNNNSTNTADILFSELAKYQSDNNLDNDSHLDQDQFYVIDFNNIDFDNLNPKDAKEMFQFFLDTNAQIYAPSVNNVDDMLSLKHELLSFCYDKDEDRVREQFAKITALEFMDFFNDSIKQNPVEFQTMTHEFFRKLFRRIRSGIKKVGGFIKKGIKVVGKIAKLGKKFTLPGIIRSVITPVSLEFIQKLDSKDDSHFYSMDMLGLDTQAIDESSQFSFNLQ